MDIWGRSLGHRTRRSAPAAVVSCILFLGSYSFVYAQDKSNFPDGYDAVPAAPKSHKVIFENACVRLLEVSVPPPPRLCPGIIISGRVCW